MPHLFVLPLPFAWQQAFAQPVLSKLKQHPRCACWGALSAKSPPYGENNEDGLRMVLLQARTRKLEAESKLAGLQKDLAELGSVSGDQAGAEEAQTMQLHQVRFLLQCHDCLNITNSCTICLHCSTCTLACPDYHTRITPKQIASYHHTPNCLRRHLVHAHDWHAQDFPKLSSGCVKFAPVTSV